MFEQPDELDSVIITGRGANCDSMISLISFGCADYKCTVGFLCVADQDEDWIVAVAAAANGGQSINDR